jgi:hypothetical protein
VDVDVDGDGDGVSVYAADGVAGVAVCVVDPCMTVGLDVCGTTPGCYVDDSLTGTDTGTSADTGAGAGARLCVSECVQGGQYSKGSDGSGVGRCVLRACRLRAANGSASNPCGKGDGCYLDRKAPTQLKMSGGGSESGSELLGGGFAVGMCVDKCTGADDVVDAEKGECVQKEDGNKGQGKGNGAVVAVVVVIVVLVVVLSAVAVVIVVAVKKQKQKQKGKRMSGEQWNCGNEGSCL